MALAHDLFNVIESASTAQISPDYPNAYVRYRLDPDAKQIFFEGVIPLTQTRSDKGIEFAPADFLSSPSPQPQLSLQSRQGETV